AGGPSTVEGTPLPCFAGVLSPDREENRSRRVCPAAGDWNGVAMTNERVPMTQEQYNKLKADIDRMQNAEMLEVTKRVAAARSMGDLSENAEYHAAREDHGGREGQGPPAPRVGLGKGRLGRAVINRPAAAAEGPGGVGARVRVKDLDSGDVEELELVGPGDEDYENNKILTSSPRGRGL